MANQRKKKKRTRHHWPWRTVVLHGASGIGKTTLSAGAPRPLFLDSNQGLMSVEGRPGFEDVQSVPVFKLDDVERVREALLGRRNAPWKPPIKTTVFDHLDDIQAISLDELTARAVKKDSRRQMDDPAQKEWGVMGNRIRRYIRQYKSVPAHKILICSTKPDRITGQLQPNLLGQLRDQLPYFADFIFYMAIGKKGRRYIHLDQTEEYLAKCRAWWIRERRIRIPSPDEDPQFLTKFFEQLAAKPKKKTRKTRGKKRRK